VQVANSVKNVKLLQACLEMVGEDKINKIKKAEAMIFACS
jgi:hypothetical protein